MGRVYSVQGSGFRVQGSGFAGMDRARRRSMGARRYEDLAAWQLVRELERSVFAFTATSPAAKDFEYCRQIRRSASSAPRNIAEGFGRFLPGDFARFIRTARGSLEETQDHLDAGRERTRGEG